MKSDANRMCRLAPVGLEFQTSFQFVFCSFSSTEHHITRGRVIGETYLDWKSRNVTIKPVTIVPLPAGVALLLSGIVGFSGLRRRVKPTV